MEQLNQWWAKELTKRTNGRVKIDLYEGGALGTEMDQPDMVLGGICDVTTLPGISPAFPVFNAYQLPFVMTNRAAANEAAYAALDAGLFSPEFDPFKILFFTSTDQLYLGLKKPITKISELSGKKIRGRPGPLTDFVTALGAAGVSMAAADVYMSLDRGIIEGLTTTPEYAINSKISEVCAYALWDPIGTGCIPIVMSKKLWNSLPGDLQATIERLDEEAKYRFLTTIVFTSNEARDQLSQNGWKVFELSPDQQALYHGAAKGIIDKWVADTSAKGLPAKQLIDLLERVEQLYK